MVLQPSPSIASGAGEAKSDLAPERISASDEKHDHDGSSASDVLALLTHGDTESRFSIMENKFVIACAFFASLSGFLFGVDQGIMSVTLTMDHFLAQFPKVDPAHHSAGLYKGIITALLELGAVIGAIFAGYVADKLGRRRSIQAGVIWFTIGATLQCSSFDYAQFVVGRFIGGIGIGVLSMTAPLYMAEIAPTSIRGFVLASEEFSIVGGIVIAYWFTFGTRYIHSDWSFRLPLLLQMVPGIILMGLSFVLPDSPRWWVQKGGLDSHNQALQVIAKLRNRSTEDIRVRAELLEIVAQVELQQQTSRERHPKLFEPNVNARELKIEIASWIDCFRPGCAKRTWIGIFIMFFQQMIGINSLVYYAPSLFEQLGLDYNLQLELSGVTNIAQWVGVIISLFLVDNVGRKPLLLWGSAWNTATLVVVAVLTGLYQDSWPEHRPAAWAGVAMLITYMVTYGMSWGPIGWSMPSELFPQSLRSKGVAFSVISNWWWNWVVGMITPELVNKTGYGAFVFYACFAAISIPWIIFCLPETKGVRLEDMDKVFNDRTGQEDREKLASIHRRLAAESCRSDNKLSTDEPSSTMFAEPQWKSETTSASVLV